jgi:transposase InsO family protein
MSGDFQDEIECLGIEASPSFVREPEGNGVAERFIRTLKENLLWVRTFDTIEELRAALVEFATRYNKTWLVPWSRCARGCVAASEPSRRGRRQSEGRCGARNVVPNICGRCRQQRGRR